MTNISVYNMATCLGIAYAFAWIMRQIGHGEKFFYYAFRITMALVAVPYLLKAFERMNGDPPTWVDCLRDTGLFLFLITVIAFHRRRFGKL